MKRLKYPNIEAERCRLGVGKKELCELLGCCEKTYYNWINGTRAIPDTALIRMHELFNASVDFLLGLADRR